MIQRLIILLSGHWAFDTEGYESGNSNEVSLVKGMVPDGLPPKDPKTVTITVTVKLPE